MCCASATILSLKYGRIASLDIFIFPPCSNSSICPSFSFFPCFANFNIIFFLIVLPRLESLQYTFSMSVSSCIPNIQSMFISSSICFILLIACFSVSKSIFVIIYTFFTKIIYFCDYYYTLMFLFFQVCYELFVYFNCVL